MKKESKRKIKNFTIEVIDYFLGLPEGLINAFDRGEFYRMMGGMGTETTLTVANICRIYNNFKKTGYIEVKEDKNHNESISFTNKARMALIDRIAERAQRDDIYRFISFDIPERLRGNRNRFRRTIKRLGFKQIQKSLWVCNKDVGELVEIASYEYKVAEYVVYLTTSNTNINGVIDKLIKTKSKK